MINAEQGNQLKTINKVVVEMVVCTQTNPIKKIEYVNSENSAVMSSSIIQNWTDSAIRCYYNNCNCSSCPIANSSYSFKCQMSSVVRVLMSELGPPDKERIWKSIIMV